jgi:diguanylate cyclase (GGDEF)-like protein/PAS domain S-box-containing protein
MNRKHLIYSVLMILLLIVIISGWFATDYLGNKARQEIIEESSGDALTLSIHLSDTLKQFEGSVKSLSGGVGIAPALMSKNGRDIERANNTLDRYNSSMNASVTYLMDADGMTVASSNRKDQDSFLGISYSFRPYFQRARRGHPSRYFAVGMTSGKRGFYASHPVQNRHGKVIGVVAIKKDLDDMETFFSQYPFCFLTSPEGIIFLSSSPAMVLKSLWPLDKAERETLIASQQFGNKLSEAVIKKEIADATEVNLEGKDYFVSRKVIGSEGWSVVLLTPTGKIWIYKLIGILSTISLCSLIIFFSGLIYLTERSHEAIRQSEESKRLLLQAVGDGIFEVDTAGRATFINPAALRMLLFSSEEILGQKVHSIIHHSHNDGSNYPVEDCPMYASYTRGIDKHVLDEMLWRKDDSSFPVEYTSTPLISDNRIIGAVITFKDITERKRAEEALNRSEMKFHTLYDSNSDAVMLLDEQGFFDCNKATLAIFCCATVEEFCSKNLADVSPPQQPSGEDSLVLANQMIATAMERGSILFEWMHKRSDTGETFPAEVLLTAMELDRKPVVQAVVRDITKRKQLEEKIAQMAHYDSLTGLPNRKLFSDRLGITLAQAQRNQKKVGIAMIDLDKFKGVNDTLGHGGGDLLLKAAAERLTAALRKSDTVARLGGDEFVLILSDIEVKEDAIQVAQKIVDSFSNPFLILTHQLVVTTSIGIAVYPNDGTDEGTLLKNADIAMYQAKQAGSARYQLFKSNLNADLA